MASFGSFGLDDSILNIVSNVTFCVKLLDILNFKVVTCILGNQYQRCAIEKTEATSR